MSLVYKRENRKKGKHPRWNRIGRYHINRTKHKRTKKIRKSKWKLEFPELFQLTDKIPYIVRKNEM